MASSRVANAENTNYNKFSRLLVDVTGKVLRKLLETRALIQQPSLHDYLTAPAIQQSLTNIIPGIIKRHQAELVYPPGGGPADVETWDITLLCAVLTCIANLTKRERKDIEEIKSLRNATVGHPPLTRLTNTEFTGYWTDLTKVINSILPRIGDQVFGNDINSLIASIKRDKDLDPLLATVETWKKDEEKFTPTRALTSVVQLLDTHNTVTIVGVSGSGKSGIAHHVALELSKQGYTIFPVERAEDILVHGNMAEKQVFVLDDPVGKHEIDLNELKEFERLYGKHEAFVKGRLKIIVTCRKNIINDNRFKAYQTVIGRSVVDLGAKENRLSENEKMDMFIRYAGNLKLTDERKNEITQREYNNFPLLCKVFASNIDKYKNNILTFFKAPFPILVAELDTIKQRDKHQYCALILCLVFEKYFDTCHLNEFNRDDNTVRRVEGIMAVCGLPRNEPLVNIQHGYEALTDVYFIKEQTRYRYIHDALFDAVAFQFGRDYPKEMLKHCSSGFLREHVRTEGIKSDDSLAIKMPKEGYIHMTERLCDDLRNGQFHDVFLNPSFNDDHFLDIFGKYLMSLKELDLRSLLFGRSPDLEGFKGLVEESDFRWDQTWFTHTFLCNKDIRVIHWILAYNHFKMFKACHSVLGNFTQRPTKNNAEETQSYRGRTYDMLIWFACLSGNITMLDILLLDGNFTEISKIRFTYNFNALHVAVISDNIAMVDKVISMGGNVNDLGYKYITPLWVSASIGNIKMCEHLLQKHGADVSLCIDNGISPLYAAANNGHTECVSVLLKHGADVNQCTDTRASPLFIAAQVGHTECVSVLLKHGADVNQCTDTRASPLFIAAQNGHTECVSVLLKHGADVNQCADTRVSPLIIAARCGHTECVSVLLKHGADVNQCTDTRVSPLYIAAERGHTECVSVLLKHGADVNQCDDTRVSPLCIAAQCGHTECVSVLLKHGADVNQCTDTRASPLFIAAQVGHTECVSVLLKHGADVNQCTDTRASPLFIAAQNGHTECVSVLLKHGADVNQCADTRVSPLIIAAQCGHTECVSVLLKHGADVNQCTDTRESPLYIAAQCGHTECVSVLLKHGADVNQCTDTRASPLYIAAQNGHTECVSVLLKHGADVNQCTDTRVSPLIIAAQCGHTECVSVLLKHGADVNQCTDTRVSPLYIAAQKGHTECVSVLLGHGADVNQCTDTRVSPLYIAAQKGHTECVSVLLGHGADVNQCTDTLASPLYIAAQYGHADCVSVLLKHGADVNQCTVTRVSPLYIAAVRGHTECVSVLLGHGADVNQCTGTRVSPLKIAAQKGHTDCVSLLIKHGADVSLCNDNGVTPLHTAAYNGHRHIVSILLPLYSNINVCDKGQWTPLHFACYNSQLECVKLLLQAGADVNTRATNTGLSPLDVAKSKGDAEIVTLLINAGATDTS